MVAYTYPVWDAVALLQVRRGNALIQVHQRCFAATTRTKTPALIVDDGMEWGTKVKSLLAVGGDVSLGKPDDE